MFTKDLSDVPENESGMLTRKPWAAPVVEIHDIENLTMHTGSGGGDGSPFSSNS